MDNWDGQNFICIRAVVHAGPLVHSCAIMHFRAISSHFIHIALGPIIQESTTEEKHKLIYKMIRHSGTL